MSFYIYAETAFHHEGSKDYLMRLVAEAKRSGVSGVKFQVLIDLDQLMSRHHSSYETAKSWVLSIEEWRQILKFTEQQGLDIILMPVDLAAFQLASEFSVKCIEIHSVSFRDEKLLSKLDESDIPLIFGVGGRTLAEIEDVVKKYHGREITLMVGFQAYPSRFEDIRIGKIAELKKLFPDCTIGYADHSSYDDDMAVVSNEYAYLLGARMFEKHISLDEGIDRIDYQSAVSAEKMATIVSKLNYLDKLLDIGDQFEMTEAEVAYRSRQKVPVAKYDLEVGHLVTDKDIELKMIDASDVIADAQLITGRKLRKKLETDKPFYESDII